MNSEETNKIEKATFVTLYDKRADVATCKRQKPGALPGLCETHDVKAVLKAHFCPESHILLFEKAVEFPGSWECNWVPERKLETLTIWNVTAAVDRITAYMATLEDDTAALVAKHTNDGWVGTRPDIVRTLDGHSVDDAVFEPAPSVLQEGTIEISTSLPGHEPVTMTNSAFTSAVEQMNKLGIGGAIASAKSNARRAKAGK